jgi:hypothetical protein
MGLPFQFVPGAEARSRSARLLLAGILLGTFSLYPMALRAQDAPRGTVGEVDGRDVSVEGGAAASSGSDDPGRENYVSNGSIVTVHSGSARMKIFAGGVVDICGPAKFTVLLAEDAITLAVNFGRVRVQLPGKTALRVFTPTIIGTPLDISGGSRDVTVGLNLDDSLCVLATSGAIQLEHQFTGEKLIVPQAGEFFLSAGKLLPVAGTPGGCQCQADEPQVTPAPPPSRTDVAAVIPPGAPEPNATPPVPVQAVAPETTVEYSVLAKGNDAPPTIPPAKHTAAAAPPVSVPVYTVVLPPLTFSASSPSRPPDPGAADMVLLIREAQVSPQWEFSGHVAAPPFAQAVGQALGEGRSGRRAPARGANQPGDNTTRKRRGFWASLKRAFGGDSSGIDR